MKVYYIEGESFMVGGISRQVRFTLGAAQTAALELVNILREEVELPPELDPLRWNVARKEARLKRAADYSGLDIEDLVDSDDNDPDGVEIDTSIDGFVDIMELDAPDTFSPDTTTAPLAEVV